MTDEAKPETETAEQWEMPEPIFRTSEGYTPKTATLDPQGDVPTEPGFADHQTENVIVLTDEPKEIDGGPSPQSVRASTKTKVRHHKKRSGCAKALGVIAGAIVLSAVAIVVVLIYFLYYFRPTASGTF